MLTFLKNFSPSDHVLKALEKLKTIFLSSIHEPVSVGITPKSYKIRNFFQIAFCDKSVKRP